MSSRDAKNLVWLILVSFYCVPSFAHLARQRLMDGSTPMPPKEFQQKNPSAASKTSQGSQDGQHGIDLSSYLSSIGEPPTLRSPGSTSVHAYRLVWIAFPASKIVVLRLQISSDGVARVYVKQTRFGDATLVLNKETSAPSEEVNGFLDLVKRADFWQLPIQEVNEPKVFEGTYWYLEGVHSDDYRLLFRRNPESRPGSLTDMGRYLAQNLAKLPDSVIAIPRADRSEPLRRNDPRE